MAKLRKPAQLNGRFARISEAVDRASERVEGRLGRVLDRASERGAERSRNLGAITDPKLRRSAAQK